VQGVCRPLVFDQQRTHLPEPGRGRVEYRFVQVEHRFLRQIGQAQLGLAPHHAIVSCCLAGQDFQQAALTGAVAADQGDLVAALDHELHAVEQGHVAVSEGDVFEGGDGHG
jgi:hypothetical protein